MKSTTRRRPSLFAIRYSLFAIRYLLFAILLLTACAPKPLLRPNGVAVAPDGSIYVMDRGNYRVVHFSAAGKVLGTFGKFGTGPEDIHSGWDAALDSQGNIAICNFVLSAEGDLLRDGVRVFTSKGQFVREIGGQDYLDETTSINKPYGLDIDAQDRVYIADFDSSTLRVFDAQGTLLGVYFGEIGSEAGQFNGINDVAVDDTRGLIYLSDNINSRIQQFAVTFTPDGVPIFTYRHSFGEYGDGPAQLAYPQGLAVDEATGRLYVADHANRRIQVFDPEGHRIAGFAPPDAHLWQILQLTVGPDSAVYATDSYNNAVWIFEPDGAVRSRFEVNP